MELQKPAYNTESCTELFVARWYLIPILGGKNHWWLKLSEEELLMVLSELLNNRNQNCINTLDMFSKNKRLYEKLD